MGAVNSTTKSCLICNPPKRKPDVFLPTPGGADEDESSDSENSTDSEPSEPSDSPVPYRGSQTAELPKIMKAVSDLSGLSSRNQALRLKPHLSSGNSGRITTGNRAVFVPNLVPNLSGGSAPPSLSDRKSNRDQFGRLLYSNISSRDQLHPGLAKLFARRRKLYEDQIDRQAAQSPVDLSAPRVLLALLKHGRGFRHMPEIAERIVSLACEPAVVPELSIPDGVKARLTDIGLRTVQSLLIRIRPWRNKSKNKRRPFRISRLLYTLFHWMITNSGESAAFACSIHAAVFPTVLLWFTSSDREKQWFAKRWIAIFYSAVGNLSAEGFRGQLAEGFQLFCELTQVHQSALEEGLERFLEDQTGGEWMKLRSIPDQPLYTSQLDVLQPRVLALLEPFFKAREWPETTKLAFNPEQLDTIRRSRSDWLFLREKIVPAVQHRFPKVLRAVVGKCEVHAGGPKTEETLREKSVLYKRELLEQPQYPRWRKFALVFREKLGRRIDPYTDMCFSITDLVRCSVTVDTPRKARDVIARIRASDSVKVHAVKNGFHKAHQLEEGELRDVNLILEVTFDSVPVMGKRMPVTLLCELQILLRPWLYSKKAKAMCEKVKSAGNLGALGTKFEKYWQREYEGETLLPASDRRLGSRLQRQLNLNFPSSSARRAARQKANRLRPRPWGSVDSDEFAGDTISPLGYAKSDPLLGKYKASQRIQQQQILDKERTPPPRFGQQKMKRPSLRKVASAGTFRPSAVREKAPRASLSALEGKRNLLIVPEVAAPDLSSGSESPGGSASIPNF